MLVLVTDIFGETPWCQSLIQTWCSQGIDVLCISPYELSTNTYMFNNEQQAYQSFQRMGGIDKYVQKIKLILERINNESNQAVTCVGFSAGAAALWQVAAKQRHQTPDKPIKLHNCIGFYPGQIRHSLELIPSCPFTLVFPQQEQHFNLEDIIQHLVTKQNVGILQVNLKHGYVNPQSDNFDALASKQVTKLLTNLECTIDPFVFKQSLATQSQMYKERVCT